MAKLEETPLGWSVNLLYLMAQASSVLMEDIDQQLKAHGEKFRQDKKMYLKNYERCIKQAQHWMEMFGLDTSTWEAVHEDSRKYTNVIADANELLRLAMLYMDRAHCDDGYYKIFRHIRSLPANGIFPDWYINRYQMHHEWIPGKGDRVLTEHHGEGVLDIPVNGAWLINLDSGGQTVLKEEQFKVLV